MKTSKLFSLVLVSLFMFVSCDILFPEYSGTGQNGGNTTNTGNNGNGNNGGGNTGNTGNTGGNSGNVNINLPPVVTPTLPTTDPAKKRGFCYNNLNEAEIKVLANSKVTWVYNWGTHPTAQEDALLKQYGIDFYPMQWGISKESDRKELRDYYTAHPECKYLLGYNEPNLTWQDGGSGITPAAAAKDWPNLEQIAYDFNLYLVGPALQFSGRQLSDGKTYGTPKAWMDAFISEYKKLYGREPRYDYFCLHCYMEYPDSQKGYLEEYYNGKSAYNKKIWLTEFCAWEYGDQYYHPPYGESMEKQTEAMTQKVNFMDSYGACEKYAWFMSHGETSAKPFNSLYVTKDGDGTLTSLGEAYIGKNNPEKNYTLETTTLTAASFDGSLTNGLNDSAFTASSGANSAKLAFDKVTNTRWESEHGKDPQWLCIDLGAEKEFNVIKFLWEGAYAKKFRIEISNDNTNWTTVLDIQGSGGGSETYKLKDTQKARYVRFYGTERATTYGYSFFEMGIFKE